MNRGSRISMRLRRTFKIKQTTIWKTGEKLWPLQYDTKGRDAVEPRNSSFFVVVQNGCFKPVVLDLACITIT